MKKLLKILAYALGSLVLLVGVFMAIIYGVSSSRMKKTYTVKDTVVPVYTSAADIAEGKRLFLSRGCSDCHGENLAGKVFIEDGAMGRYAGSNLTQGKGGILASRNDFDLERAIRHGVGQNGRALIFMPSLDFQGMSNQDVGRLIAYMRSAPAADNVVPEMKAGSVARMLYVFGKIPVFVSAERIDHAAAPVAEVKPAVDLTYGKYIAQTCTGCHNHALTGGPIQGAPPEWPPASNITSAGLKGYNEEQFSAALRTGKRPNGTEINPIMPWKNLSQMTDTEIKALFKYLQTLN